jgi:putative ABC transport system permease protein
MFRREWRQQLLVLALIVVALGATVVGAAVAVNTPPPAGAGFGTARAMATYQPGKQLAGQIATLRRQFGRVDVIENQIIPIPGSVSFYDLRAQDPHGPFGQPMLALLSGRYPAGPGQVAVTPSLASRAARPAWSPASCRTRRACWTSSPSSRRARSPRRPRSPCCSTRSG